MSASSLYGPIETRNKRRPSHSYTGASIRNSSYRRRPELVRISRRQLERAHERRRDTCDPRTAELAQAALGIVGQRSRSLEIEGRVHLDRLRDGEVGGGVTRARPAVPLREVGSIAVPPADDERLDPALLLAASPEKAGALWRAQPLVAVARVDVRAERVEIERDLARRMCAVHDREHAGSTRRRADLLHREEQRRRRGDVRDGDRPRARSDPLHDLVRLAHDEVSRPRTPTFA